MVHLSLMSTAPLQQAYLQQARVQQAQHLQQAQLQQAQHWDLMLSYTIAHPHSLHCAYVCQNASHKSSSLPRLMEYPRLLQRCHAVCPRVHYLWSRDGYIV